MQMKMSCVMRSLFFVCFLIPSALSQSTSATFGEIVRLGGTPSDAILDEARGRIYLINQNANRVDVYSTVDKRVVQNIAVGSTPLAGAMSMEGDYLYVTNSGSSSMSVIDLRVGFVSQTVSLSAVPEGVEVGSDGRVLITTQGTSATDQIN